MLGKVVFIEKKKAFEGSCLISLPLIEKVHGGTDHISVFHNPPLSPTRVVLQELLNRCKPIAQQEHKARWCWPHTGRSQVHV